MGTTFLCLRVREDGAVEPDVHGCSSEKVWVSMELAWGVADCSYLLLA